VERNALELNEKICEKLMLASETTFAVNVSGITWHFTLAADKKN
jgi:hypothetical protein